MIGLEILARGLSAYCSRANFRVGWGVIMRFFDIADVDAVNFNRLMSQLPGRPLWNPLSVQGEYIRAILRSYDILQAHEINTALRLAHFLGQGLVETGFLRAKAENLNYSAQRLRELFPRYFPTDETAQSYARQPQRIANRVYANRLGNGPEESGDGWRYRGRGFFQLTGKDNYRHYGELAGIDLVSDPEVLERDLKVSIQVAAAYFQRSGLAAFADRNDAPAVSRGVNRGDPRSTAPAHGEAERILWTSRALSLVRDPSALVLGPSGGPLNSDGALRAGATGEDVAGLQRKLAQLGYPVGTPDGVFGPNTERAVRNFQQEHNLPATGAADTATLSAINGAIEGEPPPQTPPAPSADGSSPQSPSARSPAPRPVPSPPPVGAPDKPISQSRTIWGALIAGLMAIVEFVRAGSQQLAQLFPVVPTPWGEFNTMYLLAAPLLAGLGLVIFARLDDRAKRRR